MGPPPRVRVSAQDIRQRFNAGGYAARAAAGEIVEVVRRESPCQVASEPPGTLSQIIAYFDGGDLVALAHRYLRPDGSLGASGKPDPKVVIEDGTQYWTS